MVDVVKQISFWRRSAQEDWLVACQLIENGHTRHGLFFVHLSLEKVLKAFICKRINDIAPRSHNLTRLSELSGLSINSQQIDLFADMNAFNIEGRYPDMQTTQLTKIEAEAYMLRAKELYEWLMNQF